jgi:hypothetical protein
MILVIAHNKTEVGGANIVCSFIDYLKKKEKKFWFLLPDIPVYR